MGNLYLPKKTWPFDTITFRYAVFGWSTVATKSVTISMDRVDWPDDNPSYGYLIKESFVLLG